MKSLMKIVFFALVIFVSSCTSTVKFPVSSVAPAADIVAKKKQDKNGNYKLEVTAKNLAAAERISPSSSNYVVWIVTPTDGVRSIGRLINKNAKTISIEALTPFNFNEVFITAEAQDGVSIPSDTEITRVKFKK